MIYSERAPSGTDGDHDGGGREGADYAPQSLATETFERRRGLRIRQHRPIKVFEPTAARYFGGQTEDISTTGLRIELPAAMPVRAGKLLSIHIGLAVSGQPLANRRSMIPARVVWVDRATDSTGRTQTAGIEFLASIAAGLDAA